MNPRYRVLTDRQVEGACKLRGVDWQGDALAVFEAIRQAFGMRVRRYVEMRSPLGGYFGRWEVVPCE